MANSYVHYTADGATANFAVPFGYLDKTHVAVRKDSALQTITTDYTWLNATTIHFVVNPTNGTVVKLTRTTPTTPLVDFTDGASAIESDLDNSKLQALYLIEELQEGVTLNGRP